MSQPPAAPLQGAVPVRPGAAAAAVRPARPDMSTVLSNLGNLLAMDRDGKLTDIQLQQLRSLISTQTRHIILQSLLKQQPHPLNSLPPHLNPSLPWKAGGPLISQQQFKTNIGSATAEANRILAEILPMDKVKEILAIPTDERNRMLAENVPLKNQFSTSVTWYTKGVLGFINRAGTAASGTSTPRPPASSGTSTPAGAARPPPAAASGSSAPQVPAQLSQRPPAAAPSQASGQQQSPGPSTPSLNAVAPPPARPPPNQASVPPPQTSAQIPSIPPPAPQPDNQIPPIPPPRLFPVRPDQAPSASQIPTRPPPPPKPQPPPVPVEPEDQRRKRKLNEMLKEMRPGMEYEIGVTDVLSDVIDAIVYETARSAVSLAKHRKSDKVTVKDMAYVCKNQHGISIPGFNVQLPEKQRGIPEGERRKAKSIVPKAALVAAQLANQAKGEDA